MLSTSAKTEEPVLNRRVHSRYSYSEQCTITANGRSYRARGLNISEGGISVQIQGLGQFRPGAQVKVYLQNFKPLDGVIRWCKGRSTGIQFTIESNEHKDLKALVGRLQNGEPAMLEPKGR